MRAGDFFLWLLIHNVVITNVYAQNDTAAISPPPFEEPPNNSGAEAILMTGIVVGCVIIVVILSFMICPNFLCCWCPDFVRYCCVGYPQEKNGYVRQSLYPRQPQKAGYARRNQSVNKAGYLQHNPSERKGLLKDNRGANQAYQPSKSGGAQGNQPLTSGDVQNNHPFTSGVVQGNQLLNSGGVQGYQPLKSGGVQGNPSPAERVLYEPVQYKPLPGIQEVQMPPIINPQMPYQHGAGYPSNLSSSIISLPPVLTPGPCPPARYGIPIGADVPNEVLLPPTGRVPVLGPNGEVLY